VFCAGCCVPSCSALLACPARRSPGLPPGPRPLLALLLPSLAGPACCTSWLPPSARAAAPAQLAPWSCSLKEPHAHAWIESPLDACAVRCSFGPCVRDLFPAAQHSKPTPCLLTAVAALLRVQAGTSSPRAKRQNKKTNRGRLCTC